MQNFILVKTERDNDQIRRVLRQDPLERLFRGNSISSDLLRVGRCLQFDLDAGRSLGGGGALERLGDGFVLMRRGYGAPGADGALESANRLREASKAVGADVMFGMLVDLVRDGYSTGDVDRRWECRKGSGRKAVIEALKRIHAEGVYEDRRHKVQIWAAA